VNAPFLPFLNSAQRQLLAPGMALMRRLPMRQKLLAVFLAMLLPQLALLVLAAQDLWRDRRLAAAELVGAEADTLIQPLLAAAGSHGAQSWPVQFGADSDARRERDAHRAVWAAASRAFEARLAAGLPYDLTPAWTAVTAAAAPLLHGEPALTAEETVQAHALLWARLRDLATLNAESSGLLLDPEHDTFQLIDLVVHRIPDTVTIVAEATTAAVAHLHLPGTDAAGGAEIRLLTRALDSERERLISKQQALQRAGVAVPGSWAGSEAGLRQMHEMLRSTLTADGAPTSAQLLLAGEDLFAHLGALHADAGRHLVKAIEQRIARADMMLAVCLAIFGGTLMVGAYLATCLAVSVLGGLRALRRTVHALAEGDLAHRTEVRGRDEVAEIGRLLEGMSDRLSAMVAEIRNSASMVGLTGQEVSDGSARLAERTELQATNLRSSVTAITQLSTTMAHNAEAARDIDGVTERLSSQASEGHAAMQEALQAMAQMRSTSERVTEIVGVIDDIAFQTGMLALNASIEAARAGEAGRRFAVVATDVRELAQRCAESAEEIRALIGEASAQVGVSSEKMARLSGALDRIVDGVQTVSLSLRGIASSSAEQSEGLTEVTATVGSLDEITRENAALVEASATASHALLERAGTLREAVSAMRLRQGSADEAIALVRRAAERFSEAGRTQALKELHEPQGPFLDRDLYVFAFDREGIYVAQGSRPEMVGQSYRETPGLDPDFIDRVWAAADAGGGWVDYQVTSPRTGAMTAKESFVLPIDAGLVIGCGIYRRGGDASAPPRAAAWSRTREASVSR
jgi:methyl-accepting chemotaxis protein